MSEDSQLSQPQIQPWRVSSDRASSFIPQLNYNSFLTLCCNNEALAPPKLQPHFWTTKSSANPSNRSRKLRICLRRLFQSDLASWILLVITGCYSITFEGSVKLTCTLCPCIRWLHIKWPPMRWLQTATPPGPFIFLLFLLSALPAFTLFPVCFLIFHLAGLLRISGWLYTISRVNCKGFPPTTTPWVFYLQCLFCFFLNSLPSSRWLRLMEA